jgi:DNA modification methylase
MVPPQSLDDLWLIERSGQFAPLEGYERLPGSFVPEIPYWLMLRFTKPGWTVYDPMAGSMVTRRVGDKIGRKVISVDIANRGPPDDPLYNELIVKNASTYKPGEVDMIIWHPPYRDIIQFTDNMPGDLSCMDEGDYWAVAMSCLVKFDLALKPNRVCAIVVGNIYKDGAIVPLPAQMHTTVHHVLPHWKLKGWIVKDIQNNRPGQLNLQRSRASRGDYFVFKHEAILVYKKEQEMDNEKSS